MIHDPGEICGNDGNSLPYVVSITQSEIEAEVEGAKAIVKSMRQKWAISGNAGKRERFKLAPAIALHVAKRVREERELCAAVAELYVEGALKGHGVQDRIAQAIRARNGK